MQLNEAPYCPRRDYTSNRLVPGRLQLAGRTQLLLDETLMTSGQLQTNGILNLQASSGFSSNLAQARLGSHISQERRSPRSSGLQGFPCAV